VKPAMYVTLLSMKHHDPVVALSQCMYSSCSGRDFN
jgi:hypothetical protein